MRRAYGIPFFLIARFIRRGNPWTFGLTIFLMAIAFVNLVFITSLFNGIIDGTNQQIINTYTGHLMVVPKTGDTFDSTTSILESIEDVPGVAAASSQLQLPASIRFGDTKGSWPILAVDPDRERGVINVAEKMTSGAYLQPDDTDGIIIGRQIAGGKDVEMDTFSLHGVKVGDHVTVAFEGLARDFTVRGIFWTKYISTDERAYITTKALEAMAPTLHNKSDTIIIRLNNVKLQDQVKNELLGLSAPVKVYTWQEVSGLMKTVTSSFLSINVLMTFVGVLITAVTIFIVIYVDIFGRRRQIGILRAIGLPMHIVRSTYVLQTLYYSIFGVLFGTGIFFGAVVPYFNHHPFRLPICDAVLVIDRYDFFIRAVVVILVAILSGLIPAISLTRGKLLNAISGK